MQDKLESKNYILTTYDTTQWEIEGAAVNRLKMHIPRSCPFENYTLFDLLKDLIKMYSWVLDKNKKYSLSDFIRLIKDREIKANVYGNTIIKLLEM